jgi:phage gpG-like protein
MINSEALKGILRPVILKSLERMPFVMQAYIGANMEFRGAADRIAPSTSSKLAINSGNLFRSFSKGQPGNVFKVSQEGDNFEVEYGSSLKYAAIQEFGGFIKATPVTVIKSKSGRNMNKSTYVMAQFFWAKFYQTKQPYFKRLALSVERKGGVNIPARPYFNPAVDRLRNDTKFASDIKQQVIIGIQQWQESQRRSNP